MPPVEQYDVVVLGTGAAGLTAAPSAGSATTTPGCRVGAGRDAAARALVGAAVTS